MYSGSDFGLTVIRKIADLWAGSKADSLIDYTKVARVEPMVLIDTDCLYLESLQDVQQSLLSIFAGYYLQAVALSATIGKIDVMRSLDKLNPRRSAGDNAANTITNAGLLVAQESYKHGLPMYSENTAMESNDEDEKRKNHIDAIIGRDVNKDLKELANLSIGKMFSVELTDGLHKASIPVSIRLMASSIPSINLVHILSVSSQDNSVKERYHAWKAGRLEFIKDLVLCQDLIDAHRKNLMADKDGIFTNLMNRARGNKLSTILSGNPSVATASNLVIISSTTAEQLELKVNGSLDSFKTREEIFKATYIMILVVIDKQWERVTIYSRGIHEATECSAKDLKSANKGDGVSVSEVLKAYVMGGSPSL